MSVIVKGMDMPENCQECECLNVEHFFCQVSGRAPKDENMVKRRPEWCQLIEVPPHGDLIDRDALRDNNCDAFEIKGADGTILAMDVSIIDDAPTIIPASEEEA